MQKCQLILSVFLVSFILPTYAKPTTAQVTKKDKVIFACTLTNQNQVLVTESNNRFRYQFGKAGHPELIFENDKKAAIARSPLWPGIGRSIWSNLVLQNGGYFYSVYTSFDRLSDEHESEKGVTVSKANNVNTNTSTNANANANANYDDATFISTLVCNPKKAMVVRLPPEVSF